MPRRYNLGKRRAFVAETRRRIVDAALELHTTKGPAFTSVWDIARQADVSPVTVYRHFPSLDALYQACRSRFFEKYPLPSFDELAELTGLDLRLRALLEKLYAYYDEVGDLMWPVQRDADLVPEIARGLQQLEQTLQGLAAAALAPLVSDEGGYRRAQAILLLLMSMAAWRHLVRAQGLSSREATELAVGLVLSTLRPAPQAIGPD
jgi:AcrR family transcriptional regulator